MRKLYVLLMWLLVFGTKCYGTVSDDVYVRKDVFDAKMEAFMAEIRLMNEQVRSEMSREFSNLGSRIDRLETRIDRVETRIDGVEKRMSSLETMIYWILAAVLALAPYFKDFRKPSFTLDDVKRLIEENNAKIAGKVQA